MRRLTIIALTLLLLFPDFSQAKSDIVKTDFHVFIEGYATNPAFTQMIEYVQLPRQLRKIIAWHRFPNRAAIINLPFNNTREITLPHGEGYYPEVTRRVLAATKEEMEKHPEYNLILHANMWKMEIVIRPFLQEIPKERIKMIHLYEDGYGELFKNKFFLPENQKMFPNNQVQAAIKGKTKWETNMIFGLSRFYPITYHFFGWSDTSKNPKFHPMRKFLQDLTIKDVNFHKFSRTLTEEQKQIVYKLAGFDYDYYSKRMKGKKSLVFIMGYHFGNARNEAAERNLLTRIQTDPSFSGIQDPENWIWFYKPHPSYSASNSIAPMKKQFPNLIEINPQIPFEIFTLANLKPTYTAGFSSSAFYPLNKDDILFVIRRWQRDDYMVFLKDVRHLDDKQFLNLNDFYPPAQKR